MHRAESQRRAMFQTQEIYSGFEGTHGQVIIHIAKDDYREVPAEGESLLSMAITAW